MVNNDYVLDVLNVKANLYINTKNNLPFPIIFDAKSELGCLHSLLAFKVIINPLLLEFFFPSFFGT